jgi:hypothetical protein
MQERFHELSRPQSDVPQGGRHQTDPSVKFVPPEISRMSAEDWEHHVSETVDKIRKPRPKPKTPETVTDPGEEPNLSVAAAILSSIRKDIFSRKLRGLIRADATNLRKECVAMIDALDAIWDAIQKEGVVDVKASTLSTMDLEGL